MRKANRPTPLGIEIKKRLLDLGITQKDFCSQNNIPLNRFSEVIYGGRGGHGKWKQKIADILNLQDSA